MSFVLASGLTEGILELTLYGVFTVLFCTVTYLFSTRGLISRKRPTFFVFLALVGLFLSITAHWINGIYMLYLAFIRLGGGFAAEVLYLSLSSPPALAHISLVEVATVITDGLMIYRLYVVWSLDRRVVIFPAVVLACQIVCGIRIIYDLSRETIFNFYVLSNPWVTGSLVSSLVISIYSTGMIIFRIVKMSRSIRSVTGSTRAGKSLRTVLAIIVESAVLQTTMTIGILVSFQIGLLAQAVLTALQPVVFGISVLLIHLRVGLGWTAESANALRSTPTEMTLRLSTSMQRRESEYDVERGKLTSF
ncbi:hypothetical protein MVEN_01284700 [Mycena venus]|uniref:Uncharacterized protein n=1 Tax=Mycena venus TaxID=2733690 RepID=A0A8H7CVM0_9AGAR|nr:hypothetical protein MVEN_01284700 [Mycena venus]